MKDMNSRVELYRRARWLYYGRSSGLWQQHDSSSSLMKDMNSRSALHRCARCTSCFRHCLWQQQ
jgi:hypothetical protein